jgi:hypothetical protein
MTEKTIKSGQQLIKEFVNQAAEDEGVDKGSIEAIKTLLASEGKVSVNKLVRELERLRKE